MKGGAFDAWGRLLRISLAPTAIADVLAGLTLAGGGLHDWRSALILVGASLCVYHGGMGLNDWADREEDARVRPSRPIPAGRIAAPVALIASLTLFVAGALLASLVSLELGLWAAGLALCAAGYDLFGRGALIGPLMLGLCRSGNLSFGLVAHEASWSSTLWLAPLAYGLYVFLLSRLGRHEDGEEQAGGLLSPSQLLWLMGGLFWLIALLPIEEATLVGRAVAFVLGVWASIELWRRARELRQWLPEQIIPAMGCALRRMLIFSAALCVLPGTRASWITLALVLALYPVAWSLRRAFPPS